VELTLSTIGLIYRQFKPVYWSPSSATALAEAELEYDEQYVSHAAFIKFRIVTIPPALKLLVGNQDLYALIWTTTPWTLPANKAIAVHSDVTYSIIQLKEEGDLLLVASSRIPEVLKHAGPSLNTVSTWVESILGSELASGMEYINMLQGRNAQPQPIVHADFVSSSSGSGLVHLAPGHGMDDYNLCHQLGISVSAPVDDQGCFTADALPDRPDVLQGKNVLGDGGKTVIDLLKNEQNSIGESLVWATHEYKHTYPIDWRTKLPVIIRATAQWFADVESIKRTAMDALQKVRFVPNSGKARLESFVNGRSQWCISRQRAWGVPIPALYRSTSGRLEAVMTGEVIEHIIKVIEERGIDAWWTDAEDDKAWIPPALEGSFIRGKDTMDVWFDSGTSWTTLPSRPGSPPADVYIEGTDQHRGWFQSSLLTHVAYQTPSASEESKSTTQITAPYQTLITHGFTLDEQQRKMSKSLGNVISPDEIMNGTLLPPLKRRKNEPDSDAPIHYGMGPDALRLWVASSDYTHDVVIGQPILKAINNTMQKYRVTFKWFLGVLSDYPGFEAANDQLRPELLDSIALRQLYWFRSDAHAAYTAYEPFKAVTALNKYIYDDLSAFYIEAVRDVIYAGGPRDRLRAQHTSYTIFRILLSILAPTCPLLVAEVLDHTSPRLRSTLDAAGHDPFKSTWKQFELTPDGGAPLRKRIAWLNNVHDAIKAAQDFLRRNKKLGSGLACRVVLELPIGGMGEAKVLEFFAEAASRGDLSAMFVVSGVDVVPIPTARDDGGNAATSRAEEEVFSCVKEFRIGGLPGGGPAAVGRVTVLPATKGKCPRCWRYEVEKSKVAEKGEGKEEGEGERNALCERCEDVVKSIV